MRKELAESASRSGAATPAGQGSESGRNTPVGSDDDEEPNHNEESPVVVTMDIGSESGLGLQTQDEVKKDR